MSGLPSSTLSPLPSPLPLHPRAHLHQRGQVGRIERDARRGLAVLFDGRLFVKVMRKGGGQFFVFGMRLWVVPADLPLAAIDGVGVFANEA